MVNRRNIASVFDAGPRIPRRMSAASIHVLPAPSERRSASALVAAGVIALAVAAANFALWSVAHPPLVPPDGPDIVHGVAFSGYQRYQDPTAQIFPTEDELAADVGRVAAFAGRMRTYSATENAEAVRLAGERGLRVTAGAWLDRRDENNEAELAALVRLARANPNVDRVMVGNEVILRGDMSVPALIADITRVKRSVRVPVSTAEPWHVWLRYPQLARHVDFVTVHLLPYWEGVPAEHAVDYALARYAELRRAFPKKRIVIGEIGWPSRGDRVDGAIATPAAQAAFVRDFLARTVERPLDYYLMEMFDQPWKQRHEGRAGAYWGMHDADRALKFPLVGPVETDARWHAKAAAASLIAAPLMLWFAFAFRVLRATGRVVFCVLIQGAVAALVWLATIPLEFYLDPADWVAIALLVPAAAAMLAVLLANGFEFVEVLWCRAWRREFRPLSPAVPVNEPFVSIHLPACNEPPEMVILTLDSLARLDYRNFEVIVVDNNTRDERLWRPVEAACARLGPRFRFFHLPEWPGFKAGALNFALRETDPRAEVIGVVDADYAVDRAWLARLVGHFADPSVAVVQAPQAHREFADAAFRRMANWEFDGFFRVGMHHRNERNAIIQHGTMTLVRKTALESVGGWAEWCICEDAELGLRLMQAGHDLRYVDAVLGRGLTPDGFGAFKTQRFRWAFGAMQILKRHWRALLLPGKLSAGQRYHFLTGWFSWFADALHLLFAFGALAWTAGAIAFPGVFTLPLDLYLVPVLVFLGCKALFGPVLYRARVHCSWVDVLGASLASMGLSHAIARGVFAGLARRTGTFHRTAKGTNGARKRASPAREESLMLVALALAAAGVVWRFGTGHVEAMLWAAVLAAQALPYVAAVACSWIAGRSGRAADVAVPQPQAEPELAPVRVAA
jgi:exo-beta-1,3-glucanase (GH17 family)/cellulose synthase/poly-beta-1,6-N-acetylglucosamine synthase-like glycosyltransferase